MSSKFQTNGVLTNGVDYFCLVCESRLHHEAEAFAHIEKPVHKKKFDATDYFENKENYVRKISKWYFCELCSHLLPTAARVRLHVAEPRHLENKSTKILQRIETCIVAFSRVQIDDKAWHGIIDETCAICNTEFDDLSIHLNENNHIIKLIQSKIEFDSDKNVFRKVDDSSVQCITCNMIIGMNSMDIHFMETEHKNLYQGCCDAYETRKKNSALDKNELLKSNKNNDKVKSKEDNILNIQECSNKVDVEHMTTYSAEIDDREICEIMNAKDYITTNSDGNVWCILCNWIIVCDINSHINDSHHKTILELHKNRLEKLNACKKITTAQRDMETVENTPITTKQNIHNLPDISDFVEKFQDNSIHINFELQKAICKKCTKQLHFNVSSIEDHIEEHLRNNEKVNNKKPIEKATSTEIQGEEDCAINKTPLDTEPDSKSKHKEQDMKQDDLDPKEDKPSSDMEGDIENYIKQNDMTSSSNKNTVYCTKCNSNIPYSLKSLKEHVNGVGHQRKVKDEKAKADLFKTKLKQSIEGNLIKVKTSTYITKFFFTNGLNRDVIINENICINFFSMLLLINVGPKFKCLLCNAQIRKNQWKLHIETKNHDSDLDECRVVISRDHDDEFIREYRPGNFHCGYCNIQKDSWKALESHFQSAMHSENKTSSEWRLKQAAAHVFMQNVQQNLQDDFLLRMMVFRDMFPGNNNSYSDSD